MRTHLKPHIRDASTVVRQALPAFKSVEMVHVDGGHGLWFREPEVDGDSAAPILIGREPAPIGYATAVRTEMKTELPTSPRIDPRRARYQYPLAFVVIGPEHSVAPADRAIARRGGLRDSFKAPADGPAMASPIDHSASLTSGRHSALIHTLCTVCVVAMTSRDRGQRFCQRWTGGKELVIS